MLARLKPKLRIITNFKPAQKIKNLPIKQVGRWLFPRDRYGWRLLSASLGLMVVLYAIAQADGGISFFVLIGPLLPVLILAIAGAFICFILSVGYAFNFRKGHPAPLVVMLLGLYLIFKP